MKELRVVHVDKIIFDDEKNEVMIFEAGKVNIHKAVFGKHAVWIPARCLKIVWSWRGRICSWKDWNKGDDAKAILTGEFGSNEEDWEQASLDSIANEIEIFNLLNDEGMSPFVGRTYHFNHSISRLPFGEYQCDSMGVYGYEIGDATLLPKGDFEVSKFAMKFVETGIIKASEGALGDIEKEDNVINGYLIDIRRTLWDMAMLEDPQFKLSYDPNIDKENLIKRIETLTQFPHKKRKQNYQSYFLNDGEYQEGSRDTIQRLKLMGLDKNDFFGATVLDIGCNLGSICIEADIHGAKYVAGIDYEQDYIDCARDLAKHNDCKINFTVGDLTDTEQTIKYIERIFPMEIDILFALSVYKHIGNCLWIILDRIDWKVAYIESHNAPDGEETDHVKQMIIGMDSLEGVKREFVCQTNDRSPRLVWRLTR